MAAKPLIFLSFQAEPRVFVRSVATEDKARKKGGCRDWPRRRRNPQDMRGRRRRGENSPLRRDFHGDRTDRPADRAARAGAPTSRSKPRPWRANHSQKINRVASNRRELARA